MAPLFQWKRGGNRPDLLAGAVFIGVGALGLWAGRDLPMGTLAAMGPGYLPTVIASLVILIGLAVTVMGLLRAGEGLGVVRLRPILVLLVAIAGFAFAAEYLGFVLASAWLIGVGSLADRESRTPEVAITMVVLTLFGMVVFIYALGVQIRLWPF